MTVEEVIKDILLKATENFLELTELQKDIVETFDELNAPTMNLKSAFDRVKMNELKYPEIFERIYKLPTTVPKPINQITETDLRYNLHNQLGFLLEKEICNRKSNN